QPVDERGLGEAGGVVQGRRDPVGLLAHLADGLGVGALVAVGEGGGAQAHEEEEDGEPDENGRLAERDHAADCTLLSPLPPCGRGLPPALNACERIERRSSDPRRLLARYRFRPRGTRVPLWARASPAPPIGGVFRDPPDALQFFRGLPSSLTGSRFGLKNARPWGPTPSAARIAPSRSGTPRRRRRPGRR